MKTIQKFFDSEGRETTMEKAAMVIEQTLDDNGRVVKEAIFLRSGNGVVPNPKHPQSK